MYIGLTCTFSFLLLNSFENGLFTGQIACRTCEGSRGNFEWNWSAATDIPHPTTPLYITHPQRNGQFTKKQSFPLFHPDPYLVYQALIAEQQGIQQGGQKSDQAAGAVQEGEGEQQYEERLIKVLVTNLNIFISKSISMTLSRLLAVSWEVWVRVWVILFEYMMMSCVSMCKITTTAKLLCIKVAISPGTQSPFSQERPPASFLRICRCL